MIICYPVPEIWHVSDVIAIFHFGQCLALLPSPEKWKFQNNGNNTWRYHNLTQVYHKSWSHMLYCSSDIVRDGCNCYFLFWAIFALFKKSENKWHIEVGAPPKKINISNRVQLSLGWKKTKQKRIVNQILLSKLWYIGQVYTIQKFVKEEIEKTIAELSIWKCGLGILDINTQLNSLELQWI